MDNSSVNRIGHATGRTFNLKYWICREEWWWLLRSAQCLCSDESCRQDMMNIPARHKWVLGFHCVPSCSLGKSCPGYLSNHGRWYKKCNILDKQSSWYQPLLTYHFTAKLSFKSVGALTLVFCKRRHLSSRKYCSVSFMAFYKAQFLTNKYKLIG